MKAKRKPIINIHQSLKWIRDVYRALVTYACLTVSRLYMWEIPQILCNACQPDFLLPPASVLVANKGASKKDNNLNKKQQEWQSNVRQRRWWEAYAGCRWWRWSPCRWAPPCWRPYRWSADPSRCWRAIGRACSRCFPSCHPGARSAESEGKLSKSERLQR